MIFRCKVESHCRNTGKTDFKTGMISVVSGPFTYKRQSWSHHVIQPNKIGHQVVCGNQNPVTENCGRTISITLSTMMHIYIYVSVQNWKTTIVFTSFLVKSLLSTLVQSDQVRFAVCTGDFFPHRIKATKEVASYREWCLLRLSLTSSTNLSLLLWMEMSNTLVIWALTIWLWAMTSAIFEYVNISSKESALSHKKLETSQHETKITATRNSNWTPPWIDESAALQTDLAHACQGTVAFWKPWTPLLVNYQISSNNVMIHRLETSQHETKITATPPWIDESAAPQTDLAHACQSTVAFWTPWTPLLVNYQISSNNVMKHS